MFPASQVVFWAGVDGFSLRLKTFLKFENTADALENISAIVEGKVSPKLASLLKELDDKSASLIVSDPKLGIPKIS